MKNRKSKSYLVAVLIIALLAITLGYAVFTSSLNITGTATASGSWDIHFSNAKIEPDDGVSSATLTNNNKTLTVDVNLKYPGDSKEVTVNITNGGELDAKLTGFTITAQDGTPTTITPTDGVYTSGAIKMTVDSLATGDTLTAGTSQSYTMKFEWPDTYVNEETVADTMTFNIDFEYTQATN